MADETTKPAVKAAKIVPADAKAVFLRDLADGGVLGGADMAAVNVLVAAVSHTDDDTDFSVDRFVSAFAATPSAVVDAVYTAVFEAAKALKANLKGV